MPPRRCPHCGVPYTVALYEAYRGKCMSCGQSLTSAGPGVILLALLFSALAWGSYYNGNIPAPHPMRVAIGVTAFALSWAVAAIVSDHVLRLGKIGRWLAVGVALLVGVALRNWVME